MHVGFVPETAQRMQRCLDGFKAWATGAAEICWASLEDSPHAMALALRGYGMYCFEHGHPRYLFVYAITAVHDRYPWTRAYCSVAWQVDKKWQAFEPGSCRAVLPALVIRAAVDLACMWGWDTWAGIVLLAFAAWFIAKRFDFPL